MHHRRALVVGIDQYQMPGNDLQGATADAEEIAKRLQKNEDGTPNYECRTLRVALVTKRSRDVCCARPAATSSPDLKVRLFSISQVTEF